jgi:hypothetical protein
MGHDAAVARKTAWPFLNKVINPRLSTLYKFATALDVPLEKLTSETPDGGKGKRKRATN